MKVDVRVRGLQNASPIRDHAVRRVHFHLSRFGTELSSVTIHVSDTNGPKGGVDKRCSVTARGRRFGSSALEEHSTDLYLAVDTAVARLARAIGREIERARTLSASGPSIRTSS